MKKDSFVKGAMVATLCIVFSKILGIIYVIPFHSIIDANGRALYSYAYNMYTLFLNFSTIGIPLAISKLVSEYHSLGYEDAKKRTYRISLIITFIMAIVSTIALVTLAPVIAKTIISDIQGGNTINDITFVLRVSASAILFVTVLSALRGYLQGHKYITSSSISQVIEQFVRVVVIIAGSFIAMKLWGTKEAVGIAVFGATAGSIAALIYLELLMIKERKNEKILPISDEEKKITNKHLIKQLISYTIPFIVVSIAVSLYNTIDMLTIVKPLVKYCHFTGQNAEMILSIISTWGAKLNSIVTSIAAGMVVAVLPNITSDFVKKDFDSINDKANRSIQMVLYLVLPMVIGLSFLAKPVWTIFYGQNNLASSVFRYSIFTALFYSSFLNIHTIMQSLSRHKTAAIAIVSGLITKAVLNIPLIMLFNNISFLKPYYGSVTATILAYVIAITICIIDLKKNLNISFKDTGKKILHLLSAVIIMCITLFVIKLYIPLNGGRMYSCIIVAIYALIGGIVYLGITVKTGAFHNIFGESPLSFVKKRLRRK